MLRGQTGNETRETDIRFFFSENHRGTHSDTWLQITDCCDANDQKQRGDFWIFHLKALKPSGLNSKHAEEKLYIVVFMVWKSRNAKCHYMKILAWTFYINVQSVLQDM